MYSERVKVSFATRCRNMCVGVGTERRGMQRSPLNIASCIFHLIVNALPPNLSCHTRTNNHSNADTHTTTVPINESTLPLTGMHLPCSEIFNWTNKKLIINLSVHHYRVDLRTCWTLSMIVVRPDEKCCSIQINNVNFVVQRTLFTNAVTFVNRLLAWKEIHWLTKTNLPCGGVTM